MNKSVNMLLLVLLFPVIALTLFIGFDLPVEFLKTTGSQIPYTLEIYLVFAGLMAWIGGRRSLKRWMGAWMITRLEKYKWNEVMSKERYRQARMYLLLESLVHVAVALGLNEISGSSLPVVVVLLVFALDHLIFAFLSGRMRFFRVGLTSKALLVADRDVKAIYFTGLKQVSVQQQSIFFDYVKELQLDFPVQCIPAADRAAFKTKLAEQLNRETVHFSESFKNF